MFMLALLDVTVERSSARVDVAIVGEGSELTPIFAIASFMTAAPHSL